VRKVYIIQNVCIVVAILMITSCGVFIKGKDPVLQMSPYEDNTAFYGKVVDLSTQEPPRYPIKISLEPDDPGNHLVVDGQYFYIEDKGLEPDYDYTLNIRAQYYIEHEMPLKYESGKSQNLGIIQLKYIEAWLNGPFELGPFEGFNPGSGIIEKHGWSISSFLNHWRTNFSDRPFKFDDVKSYVQESLGENASDVKKDEIKQAIKKWLAENQIEKYGRQSYKLK